jgi:hypothetical protein
MLLQLKLQEDGVEEWCILEFQGEIISKEEGNAVLGMLRIEGKEAVMGIGNQIVRGVVKNLENPIMVTSDEDDGSLEVVAFAHKKLVFSQRPQPRTADSDSGLFVC